MGYCIKYDLSDPVITHYKEKRKRDLKPWLPWISVLCVILLFCITPIRNRIVRLMIPGDPEVTSEAFSRLVGDLEDGTSLKSAVTVFCETVIENG